MAETGKRMFALEDDPLWYKDAIIYEVHVRAFYDGDADGVGDFAGLTEKLEYLEELGITAIWLLPFYPSPLRDDGYDIADYNNILPVYGTIPQFKTFVSEAHRHGIRVITELVLNHTSDQHPWFQRARHSPPGSRYRDYYVWSDTTDKYRDARIIFTDSETSNWSWDPEAKAFFWHRFYHHQPDLNYDNPVVRNKMLNLMDFWLKMGVDGVRVDAVPYLFERDGTDCENLPETHEYVRELRRHIDKKFKNRMLLAEANQWPEDTAAYFGKGDEFHMSFHFPIMPRLFMALRMEDRFPILDILRQTPAIPENAQWALFLRNHDELTLEMVTDEERDYMYRAYAADPAARINLGIRRRLAPLLGNDRRKIELMNSLLLSLPGTPVLYYGDEIGMGDNYYLGDRNGVRTPMQWSSERNTGFSSANPQRLYLPPIIDPEYHYETINVENQIRNPDSLAAQGLRARQHRVLPAPEPPRPQLPAPLRGRVHPLRGQFITHRPADDHRPLRVQGLPPGGPLRADGVPAGRRRGVLLHPQPLRLLLVLHREGTAPHDPPAGHPLGGAAGGADHRGVPRRPREPHGEPVRAGSPAAGVRDFLPVLPRRRARRLGRRDRGHHPGQLR